MLREIDEGRAAAAALPAGRRRRVGVGAIDAAGAARRHHDRSRSDDQAAHGNGIRRWHENRTARSGALRAGELDRRNVEAARKQQHGGESEQEFHRATPLEGRPPRRKSPGIAPASYAYAGIGMVNAMLSAGSAGQRGQT